MGKENGKRRKQTNKQILFSICSILLLGAEILMDKRKWISQFTFQKEFFGVFCLLACFLLSQCST